jgi:hypothetical protein
MKLHLVFQMRLARPAGAATSRCAIMPKSTVSARMEDVSDIDAFSVYLITTDPSLTVGEYCTLFSNAAVRIPEGLDAAEAAPLLCAGKAGLQTAV